MRYTMITLNYLQSPIVSSCRLRNSAELGFHTRKCYYSQQLGILENFLYLKREEYLYFHSFLRKIGERLRFQAIKLEFNKINHRSQFRIESSFYFLNRFPFD